MSATLLRYIREAPLIRLAQDYSKKTLERKADEQLSLLDAKANDDLERVTKEAQNEKLRCMFKKIRKHFDSLAEKIKEQDARINELIGKQSKANKISYIKNLGGSKRVKKVHYSFSNPLEHPSSWVTVCGWPYSTWRFDRLQELPECDEYTKICDTCLVRSFSSETNVPSGSESDSSSSA